MIDDIVACGANIFLINNQAENLNIAELELLRRKTDVNYDEAYVSVILENEYYAVDADMVLYYSFYDVGGWILEYYEVLSSVSRVIKSPYSEETFVAFACESFDDCSVLDRSQGASIDGTYCDSITFSATRHYNYSSVIITGRYLLTFYDNIWHEECYFESITTDWSKMLGRWSYTHSTGDYIYFDLVSIDIYDGENCSVTYSYSSSPWNWLTIYSADNTEYTFPLTTKDYFITQYTDIFMGIEVVVPSGLLMQVQLGDSSQADTTGNIILDVNDGGTMAYWDNPHKATTVPLEKIS